MPEFRNAVVVFDAPPSQITGFIGWERLRDALRRAGEFKSNEIVSHFEISKDGITYGVRDDDHRR